jgi:phosphoribosylformylglycinamidine synthase
MGPVRKFADQGGLVIGICNGFQILAEAGFLPGALMRNSGLKYICKQVHLRTETTSTPFTHSLKKGEVLEIPIGHMEGNYFCDEQTLAQLKKQDRIVFRYSTPAGEITADANPNGSLYNIAGISNEGRNVLGMMPHPDRSSEALLGSADGLKIFQAMVSSLVTK